MRSNKSSVSNRYILVIGFLSFFIAVISFWLSQILIVTFKGIFLSFLFLIFFILIGILGDILGTAVTAATEAPFHAKAANKIAGAAEGIYFIRNADRVANICNDVIGDIAGTLSGALGITIILQLILSWSKTSELWLNVLMTGLIVTLTVSGKAAGKKLALSQPNDIVFMAGKFIVVFKKLLPGSRFF